MVGRDTPEPNARGDYVRPRTVQADVFEPKPLLYKAKRQTPATARQKKHLKELADYHKINLNLEWETLTRNEASRQVDRIISQYGRILK